MRVGSLVECIQGVQPTIYNEIVPILKKPYTVRDILNLHNGVFIRLEEIINHQYQYEDGFEECGFDIKCFRELMPPIENIEEFINKNVFELEEV